MNKCLRKVILTMHLGSVTSHWSQRDPLTLIARGFRGDCQTQRIPLIPSHEVGFFGIQHHNLRGVCVCVSCLTICLQVLQWCHSCLPPRLTRAVCSGSSLCLWAGEYVRRYSLNWARDPCRACDSDASERLVCLNIVIYHFLSWNSWWMLWNTASFYKYFLF